MNSINGISFERLNNLDTFQNCNNGNYKIVRFAFNDIGNNAFALLDLINERILSYSLSGKSQFIQFNKLT